MQPSLFFVLGMLCPILLEDQKLRSQLSTPMAASAAILTTICLCLLSKDFLFMRVPSIAVAISFFPLFLVTAAGNTLFGFLVLPSIRCLGTISFSMYLLHGIIFLLVFRLLKSRGITDMPQAEYWLINIATAIFCTLVCAITYRWIEFPFLSAKRKKLN